ncbi:lamina-associated polypeptide 2 [Aplysia californica]|uniref:Lamina-associated polypeptide 2 n=1 Tax=Aplysia californica TaxID=6500 RepID=A0ABM0K700_APLCA|nr:lamina-associated polypeptide 2 [Aplysia californica]
MPLTNQIDYSSLSDEELTQMLVDYGIDVGPINVATRGTYERKLFKLKTGEASPPTQNFEPVPDDDEEDEEVELKLPSTSTRSTPSASARMTSPSSIPVPTQTRFRREIFDQSTPIIDSRPSLSATRRTPTETLSSRPSGGRPLPVKVEQESKGVPLVVKLIALAVVVVLIYLIYTNMEPQAISNIPSIQNKMEV